MMAKVRGPGSAVKATYAELCQGLHLHPQILKSLRQLEIEIPMELPSQLEPS